MYHTASDEPSAVDEDVLAQVAEIRAAGKSWEEAARAVEWDVVDLRRVTRNNPHYEAALAFAERERDREAEADGLQRLRALLQSKRKSIVLEAAEIITQFLTDKRRDQTRLEIERLRAQTHALREQNRRAKAEEANKKEEREEGLPPMTPEENRAWDESFRHGQEYKATVVSRDKKIVHLWGGCHKIGDTLPDDTDIPLVLVADMTIQGQMIYWAMTYPPPANMRDGPFLPAPGKPIGEWPVSSGQ